jgi:hypothetical protein
MGWFHAVNCSRRFCVGSVQKSLAVFAEKLFYASNKTVYFDAASALEFPMKTGLNLAMSKGAFRLEVVTY